MEVGEVLQLLEQAGDKVDYILSLPVFDGEVYSDLVDELIVLSEDIADVLWNVEQEGIGFVTG